MPDAFVDIGWKNQSLKKGQKEATKIVERFEKRSAKAMKNSGKGLDGFAKKFAGPIAGFLTLRSAVSGASEAFERFASFEALVFGLDSITGSAGQTEEQLKRLREVAKNPGLGFREAVEGSIKLQSVGLSAEDAEKTLAEFANALALVGGTKADLSGIIRALGQISAKGKVSAEEIYQIAERLPQVRQAMKDAFGTADTEVLQRRGIDSDEFIARMVESLGNLERATAGTRNQLDNMSDSIDQAKVSIGRWLDIQNRNNGILDRSGDLVDGLRISMDRLGDAAETAADLRTLEDVFEDLGRGGANDLEQAREALTKLNNEPIRKDLARNLDIDEVKEYLELLKAVRKIGSSEAANLVPELVAEGQQEAATKAVVLELESAAAVGKIEEFKRDLGQLEAFAQMELELADPGSKAERKAKLLVAYYRDLARSGLGELTQRYGEYFAQVKEVSEREKVAADAAAERAKAQDEYNKNVSKIEAAQLDVLPDDAKLKRFEDRLKGILSAQNLVDVQELSELVSGAVEFGDFELANEAGLQLIEAKKLQEQINRLSEANVSATKAAETRALVAERYRIETEIDRLRADGNNEAAAKLADQLETQKQLKSLMESSGLPEDKAAKLIKERFKISKAIAAAEKARGEEIFALEQRILALRAGGDTGGAAELERELQLRRQAVDLQNQLNLKYSDALKLARARNALEGQAAKKGVQAELEVLRLRAAGKDGAADALQRENDIKAEAVALQNQLNVSQEEALKLAREKRDLQDQIDGRKDAAVNADIEPDGRRKIKFRDGVEKRKSFQGLDDPIEFPGLDNQTFKGLDELSRLNPVDGGILRNVVDQANQNIQPDVKAKPVDGDNQVITNTERIAVAVEKLGAA